MTATIPAQQGNRDSMTIVDALATLVEAGFKVSAAAELLSPDGGKIRIVLAPDHAPRVSISQVISGVQHNSRYVTSQVVDGVEVPFDTRSAVEFVNTLLRSTTRAVTR